MIYFYSAYLIALFHEAVLSICLFILSSVIHAATKNITVGETARVGPAVLDKVVQDIRRFRLTAKFILGAIDGFEIEKDSIPFDNLNFADQEMLVKLAKISKLVKECYEK